MKLILINGPAGVGKSTIAKRLHEQMPLSFLLDIDAQRRYISGYREQKKDSRILSYVVAKAIVESYLAKGHSIIVDKIMVKDEALGQIQPILDLGKHYGAEVFEFILTCDKDVLQKRADARGYRENGLLTRERVGEFWESAQELIKQRPDAKIINTDKLDADSTFQEIASQVSI